MIPGRGDIVWLDLQPTRGHEQTGRRPAVVVSDEKMNSRLRVMWVVPISSHGTGTRAEVLIETKKVQGVALVSHLRSVDWHSRNLKVEKEPCPKDALKEIQEVIVSIALSV